MSEQQQGTKTELDPMKLMAAWLQQVVVCLARGAVGTFGACRPEIVLVTLCKVLGVVICQLYGGDEIAVAQFRKACRDAFCEATKAMPIVSMDVGKPPPVSDTAIQPQSEVA